MCEPEEGGPKLEYFEDVTAKLRNKYCYSWKSFWLRGKQEGEDVSMGKLLDPLHHVLRRIGNIQDRKEIWNAPFWKINVKPANFKEDKKNKVQLEEVYQFSAFCI